MQIPNENFVQCFASAVDATSTLQGPNLHNLSHTHILNVLYFCDFPLTLPLFHHDLAKPPSCAKLDLRDHITRSALRHLIGSQRLFVETHLVQECKLAFDGRLLPPARAVVDVDAFELGGCKRISGVNGV